MIKKVIAESGVPIDSVKRVVIGSTGAGRKADGEILLNALKASEKAIRNLSDKLHVISDARIALEGAFGNKPGSILIAGTGSIMFGKETNGIVRRVGGFGRFLGDEGSGYTIGRLGLTLAAKAFDGRAESTIFTTLLKQNTGIDSSEMLIAKVYKENFDIASAAPLVLKAAEQGDAQCIQIIRSQCAELLNHITAMQKKLQVDKMNLSFVGGLLTSGNIYSRMLRSLIDSELENVSVIEPEFPPEIGAVLMGKFYANNADN